MERQGGGLQLGPGGRWVYASCVLLLTAAIVLLGTWYSARRTLQQLDRGGREHARPAAVATPGPVSTPPPAAGTDSTEAGPTPLPGTVRISPIDRLEYVWIAAGEYRMGCVAGDLDCHDDERPAHAVRIPSGFWMTRSEVTVAAYRRFAKATGRGMPKEVVFNPGWSLADHPIVNAGRHDAVAYCHWVGGRLPSEAEWEYAARGGLAAARYPSGDTIGRDDANYRGSEGRDRWPQTSPVGSFPANGSGLLDMAGNVREWVADRWHDSYQGAPADGSAWGLVGSTEPGVSAAVVRGGSWLDNPAQLRCSYRSRWFWPGDRFDDFGIRCVCQTLPG